jgi:hypothetical protein
MNYFPSQQNEVGPRRWWRSQLKMFKIKYKKLNMESCNRSIRDPSEQKPLKTLPRTVIGVV